MEALQSVGIFAAQTALIVLAIVIIIMVIAMFAAKAGNKPEIEIDHLDKKIKDYKNSLKATSLTKSERKELRKKLKEELKSKDKEPSDDKKKKIYVLDFNGDVQASAVENLREEITALLTVATPQDEVVVKVESPGGVVHGYGLAASQLLRIRERNIPLTICIDKVAASGGYLMSVTANKIICAPFAIVGSIGVVAQVPNFNKLLKKHDVEYKEYTAGDFKRTVSVFGEITPKGEEKFKEQLEDTHVLFKSFVHKFRPQLQLDTVATGEYWYGEQALEKGLVDILKTSDDYLFDLAQDHSVIQITHTVHESLSDKISGALGTALEKAAHRILEKLETRRFL